MMASEKTVGLSSSGSADLFPIVMCLTVLLVHMIHGKAYRHTSRCGKVAVTQHVASTAATTSRVLARAPAASAAAVSRG